MKPCKCSIHISISNTTLRLADCTTLLYQSSSAANAGSERSDSTRATNEKVSSNIISGICVYPITTNAHGNVHPTDSYSHSLPHSSVSAGDLPTWATTSDSM